jgi:hypothetical protein
LINTQHPCTTATLPDAVLQAMATLPDAVLQAMATLPDAVLL